MSQLRELVLDITNKCPMLCLHCSADSSPTRNFFISYEKAMEVISDAGDLGAEILSLTGGEPSLHPRLLDIISYARRVGFTDIRLFTSGLGKFDWYALKSAGLAKVFFNIQGAKPEIHDFIAKTRGAFVSATAQALAAKRAGLYTGFHFVPMKPNWRELPQIFELARRLDIDEVGVLRFVPQGRGLTNSHMLQLDDVEFREFLKIVAALIKNDGRPYLRLGCPFNSIAQFIPGWVGKKCPAADDMCHVLIDGSVAPCSAFKYHRDLKAGNIYEKRFKEIWCSGFSAFTALRQSLGTYYDCTAQRKRLEIVGGI